MAVNPLDAGAALCEPFLVALPVSGLSISVVSEAGAQSTIGTSDLIAAQLEGLQFQLGEGPTPDVLHTGRPVLTPDLGAEELRSTWPAFSAAAIETGACALFSFPLLIGTVTVGVVSLYALVLRPPWPDDVVASAVRLARDTADSAVELAARSAAEDRAPAGRRQIEMRREVHQASGMVMVQLDSTIGEALTRLRAYAFATDQPIDVVARRVVAGSLSFAAADD